MRVLITELKHYFYEPSCHIAIDQVPRIASNWPKVDRCLLLKEYAFKHVHLYANDHARAYAKAYTSTEAIKHICK